MADQQQIEASNGADEAMTAIKDSTETVQAPAEPSDKDLEEKDVPEANTEVTEEQAVEGGSGDEGEKGENEQGKGESTSPTVEEGEKPPEVVIEKAEERSGQGESDGEKPVGGDTNNIDSEEKGEGEKTEGVEQKVEDGEKEGEGKTAEGEEKEVGQDKSKEGEGGDTEELMVEVTDEDGKKVPEDESEAKTPTEGEEKPPGEEESVEPEAAKEGEEGEKAEDTAEEEGEKAGDTAEEEGEKAGDTTEEEGEKAETPGGELEKKSQSPMPQSDTFMEGERPESPHRIGAKLSREGSPIEPLDIEAPDKLEPDTPERSTSPVSERVASHVEIYDDEDDDDEEEEDIMPTFDRETLIEQYHVALAEREQLQQHNHQLQHKLADYFRKKKADESRQDYDKNVTDQEQRYLKYIAQLEDLRRQDMYERNGYKLQMEDLQVKCEDKKDRVDKEREKFVDFKKQVALNSINSRSGRPIPPKDIEQYLLNENKKETDVVNVRLENIKLKNKLKKKEQHLKSKEELAEGLHLIDFEQLKIENQTYNEKIEERNEELLKLRKKITSTVQVLTHLKEKLQYVQAENQVQKVKLRDVEATVGQKRDVLSRTKQARDALRIDNQKLRQNCGLLGNEPLLRDFEDRKDEGDDLRERLERMKMLHAELTLNCNQVRRKIDQARAGRS